MQLNFFLRYKLQRKGPMRKILSNDLYACGGGGLPGEITLGQTAWRLVRTFKHDFFAATGLYESMGGKEARQAVLKVNRRQPFFGISLEWLGRCLCSRETGILEQLQDMDQVPRLLGKWEQTGFVYEYIEGKSLDEKPPLPDSFFDDLEKLLERIHRRNICYLDMNKRGNILVGKDGRPYLIDFQISLYFPRPGRICEQLQQEDRYHLLKHKRRLRPDLLSEDERIKSYRKSFWIRIHRIASWPYRVVRRNLMRWLLNRKCLRVDDTHNFSPENDPRRFERKP